MLGLHIYQGTFLSIPIIQVSKKGKQRKPTKPIDTETSRGLDTASPIRFPELDVLDMAFLYETKEPVLAVLYNNPNPQEVRMKTYEITHNGTEFNEWRMKATSLDTEPKILIPVPGSIGGGLLVVGSRMVYYFSPEATKPLKQVLHHVLTFVTWGMIDAQRYLLGDEYGKLHIMFLELADDVVQYVKVEEIGQVTILHQHPISFV